MYLLIWMPVTLLTLVQGGSAYVVANSNSIKNPPPAPPGQPMHFFPVSAGPDFYYDMANKHQPLETYPVYTCVEDDDCAIDEFCHSARNVNNNNNNNMVCLACRKRRRRCMRDAMCCMGNYCSNGICMPVENEHERFLLHHGYAEDTIMDTYNADQATADTNTKFTTSPSGMQPFKGRDGDVCLRSSDCGPGLCCARHFWSKICKPVLEEGQVCTKHRRKGTHGLEIFQRCHCGAGLSCKLQKGEFTTVPKNSRLHTCQRH